MLKEWYRFKEVKQNWFGFSARNNSGRGLGGDFAKALNENLHNVFKDFGNEEITKGSRVRVSTNGEDVEFAPLSD